MVLIKTLFYTGVRVSELVAIRIAEVDIERCQIRIQPYSGHVTPQSLKIYSRLSLADAQPSYNHAMERFPIQ